MQGAAPGLRQSPESAWGMSLEKVPVFQIGWLPRRNPAIWFDRLESCLLMREAPGAGAFASALCPGGSTTRRLSEPVRAPCTQGRLEPRRIPHPHRWLADHSSGVGASGGTRRARPALGAPTETSADTHTADRPDARPLCGPGEPGREPTSVAKSRRTARIRGRDIRTRPEGLLPLSLSGLAPPGGASTTRKAVNPSPSQGAPPRGEDTLDRKP